MIGLDEGKFEKWIRQRMDFITDLEPVMYMRRFFLTQGLYFGFGGKSVKVGDKVVVLLGGKVPYILRRLEEQEDMYKYIGDAYVHGIMNGEAVDAMDTKLKLMKLK